MDSIHILSLTLNEKEMLRLYSLLKSLENELDKELMNLLIKTEKIVYDKLTIQEIENLKKNGELNRKL